ncbi:MAG: biotin--[acetyl-CoA-carboxylase] ligase [Cyclobacteriaceae bacterium]
MTKISEYKLHKYFAKTLFLGKKVDSLTHCHSTNDEMIAKIKLTGNHIFEGHIVQSSFQTKGKGQRGNAWISEPGKNLLFSVNLNPTFLSINKLFFINVITGIAIHKAIEGLVENSNIEIKWPNDIYINDLKVGGVLVETILNGNKIENVIVGVGLNVNQEFFSLNTATSLFNESKTKFDLDQVLESVLLEIESQYLKLKAHDFKSTLFYYHQNMRWRGEIHVFSSGEKSFEGEIIGIDDKGRLVVKQEDQLFSYDVKEIEFVN